jgi:hypothetical protein
MRWVLRVNKRDGKSASFDKLRMGRFRSADHPEHLSWMLLEPTNFPILSLSKDAVPWSSLCDTSSELSKRRKIGQKSCVLRQAQDGDEFGKPHAEPVEARKKRCDLLQIASSSSAPDKD